MKIETEADTRRLWVMQFARILGVIVALLAAVPSIVAFISGPNGLSYLGFQHSTDDSMVYAAWMRQAMDGQFFFDNRFTTDPQPALTVNLYYFLLGQVARFTGIAIAEILARAIFSYLFVILIAKLLLRTSLQGFGIKLALLLITFGGGVGFLCWQSFGRVAAEKNFIANTFLQGMLPIDVWQPEAFVFPSMLVNSLFMVSLCLILVVLLSVIGARSSWKPVLPGFLALGLLMNIHSYDVLLIGMILVGFLISSVVAGRFKWDWLLRVGVILLGALPAALWFLHVLAEDPVFRARAATPTFAPSFRQLAFGFLPAIVLSVVALYTIHNGSKRHRAGAIMFLIGLVVLFAFSIPGDQYWMSIPAWGVSFVCALALIGILHTESDVLNLFISWAVVGLIACYFPALFQRKLLMGLAIPLGALAAVGLAYIMQKQEKHQRNMVALLALILLSGSSVRWLFREFAYIRDNVSNTIVHPVYLTYDQVQIVRYLNRVATGRQVLLAMPGVPARTDNPDLFRTPLMPDLNPIMSGLTGVYTYAGHWSETPDYNRHRDELAHFFLSADHDERQAFLERIGADYIIVPREEAFSDYHLGELRSFGVSVVSGSQFDLIQVLK